MKYFTTFAALLLAVSALPTHAATLSVEAPLAAAEQSFYLPVVLSAENDSINTVSGSVVVPSGITVESIDTSGSAFSLFAEGPTYELGSHTITFTAGAPHGIPSGDAALLFIIKARAIAPGSYAFAPANVSAYANDGQGTATAVAYEATEVSVGAPGTVAIDSLPRAPIAPVIAAIGRDDSLFEGKWFATFYGGAAGSAVDHYEVREGFWHSLVHAERYYVLEDQRRTSTVWVTAVGENGKKVTTAIPAFEPWPERLLVAGIVLVLGLITYVVWRRMRRVTL